MKIAAYEVRPDEAPIIKGLCDELGIEVSITTQNMSMDTVEMAKGADAVTGLGQSDWSNEVLDTLKEYGVKVLSARCVGYDSYNVPYATKLGFKITGGAYDPNGVAEYTVMAILMCLRKVKRTLNNTNDNDFTLRGKMGRELRSMTVGVLGAGKIGRTVLKLLSSFGCKLLCYDVFESEEAKQWATYVDLDTIYRECDVITLHMPLLPSTEGMINKEAIAKMKDGVIIINNARGLLVNREDIIEGVETEKIGALFMDAFPGEEGIIHVPHEEDIIRTEGMPYFRLKYLTTFVNVYHTPHMAFFTQEAAASMARCGVIPAYDLLTKGDSPRLIPECR